jgi:hypothetical protein
MLYPYMPCGQPPLKRPHNRLRGGRPQVGRLAAVFYPRGHPTPYASAHFPSMNLPWPRVRSVSVGSGFLVSIFSPPFPGLPPMPLIIGVWRGVSERVKDGRRPPPCRQATRETAVRSFQGFPPAGHRRVGHDRPGRYFRKSMAAPCHTPMPPLARDKEENVETHLGMQSI